MLIQVSDAQFGYADRSIVQLNKLELAPGRCLGIFGPNGSGKTTLVRGLIGLLRPIRGQVLRDAKLRVGYVPQLRGLEQHWPMTALDVASLGLSSRRRMGWVGKNLVAVRKAIDDLGLGHLADHPFASLSGGQQQRMILAGALADAPNFLVLDEPTEGLDLHNRSAFLDILRTRVASGLCIVLISHEVDDLLEVADDVAWVHPGAEAGEPSQVELIAADELLRRLASAKSKHASSRLGNSATSPSLHLGSGPTH
jgi:ABC-type Mn2+/Zn2+ transport system ATPase subunit